MNPSEETMREAARGSWEPRSGVGSFLFDRREERVRLVDMCANDVDVGYRHPRMYSTAAMTESSTYCFGSGLCQEYP